MRPLRVWPQIAACFFAVAGAVSAQADVMQTKSAGTYKVELHVLPAEPFFSKDDVANKHLTEGMAIEGGATPVAPGADSHPNHHLVVHIHDTQTGKVIVDATVTMNFVPLDAKGNPVGTPVDVPIVVMQAIGGGPASTHYGNNVTMPAGRYGVVVTVNGKSVRFVVAASDAPPTATDHMNMGHMKM
jgi:hypothetical protein